MHPLIQNRKKIEEFCKEWNVKELQVFGSALRNDFRPDGDIDIVVDFLPGTVHTLISLAQMEEGLERIFDRHIDLITRKAVEESRNYIRRKTILSTMEKVYTASAAGKFPGVGAFEREEDDPYRVPHCFR